MINYIKTKNGCLIFMIIATIMFLSSINAFASPAPDPKVVFDNYPVISTYIENCYVGDVYTLSAQVIVGDVVDNDVAWDFTWATAAQQIGDIQSISGNAATIEALSIGNTKIVATALKNGTSIASAEAILNVIPKSLYDEYWRPQFHFSPNVYWNNDPNGLVYYEGEWHLFFQYNPLSNGTNSPICWGHAVSPNMIHWVELPVAMYPDNTTFGNTAQPGISDLGNLWSGSAVVDEYNTTGFFTDTPEKKGLVAFFTHSGTRQQQSIAYSTDKGRTWIKYEGNPVISAASLWDSNGSRTGDPGDPLNNTAFRDPKVFWHDESNQWIMVVAGGPYRFYSSDDLKSWRAEAMQPEITGECPDLFELQIDDTGETKWILSEFGTNYRIGEFKQLETGTYAGKWGFVTDTDPLNPNGSGIARYPMSFGLGATAGQTYSDAPNNRRILAQWAARYTVATQLGTILYPYNGSISLHQELTLTRIANGTLRVQKIPVKEYEILRAASSIFSNVTVTPTNNVMDSLSGDTYEIKAEFTPEPGTTEVGFKLRVGGGYETVVKYDIIQQTITTDPTNSGPRSHIINGIERTLNASAQNVLFVTYSEYVPMENGKIDMHIFVDKSSVEVHAGRYVAAGANMILPHQTESGKGIEVYSVGGNAQADIEFYELGSIWGYSNIDFDVGDSGAIIEVMDAYGNTVDPIIPGGNNYNLKAGEYSYTISRTGNLPVTKTFAAMGDEIIKADKVYVSITGPATVASGEGAMASYTISANAYSEISGIELEFEVDGDFLSSKEFTAMDGFIFIGVGNYGTPIYWKNDGNIWTGKTTLVNLNPIGTGASASGLVDILNMKFNVAEGMLGTTEVKLNYITMSYKNGQIATEIIKDTVITTFEQYYSPYDLNKDGVIDLNDITFTLQYLLITSNDPEWEQAHVCDFSSNNSIGIEDLVLILAHYTIPYYG